MIPLSAVSGKTLAESARRTSKLIKFFGFFLNVVVFFFFLVWLILAQNNVKFLFFFQLKKMTSKPTINVSLPKPKDDTEKLNSADT